jgi:hypothetical protein
MEKKLGRRSFLKSGAKALPALAILGLVLTPAMMASTACEGCADACFTTCKDGCDSTCKGNCQGDCSGSTK